MLQVLAWTIPLFPPQDLTTPQVGAGLQPAAEPGALGPALIDELRARSSALGLPPTGELDDAGRRIDWPIAGRLGVDLYGCTYVDGDPGPGRESFRCAAWTSNGHEGIDLYPQLGFEAMSAGPVAVFAAAPGIVLFTQDGLPDQNTNCQNPDPPCGNSVVIDHGGGLWTVYCHLQTGSISVLPDDVVDVGQQIATVGSSGCSTAPHLQFEVRLSGLPVDPMLGPCNPHSPVAFVEQRYPGPVVRSDVALWGLDSVCTDPTASPGFYVTQSANRITINNRFSFTEKGTGREWRWLMNGNQFAQVTLPPTPGSTCSNGWVWCYTKPPGWGPGEVQILIDGGVVWTQPFFVLAPGQGIPAPTPPRAAVAGFRGPPSADRAFWVEVLEPAFDEEYDTVRYKYEWYVDGLPVRSTDSVALADALPASMVAQAGLVECFVTPWDADGPGPSEYVKWP